VLALCGCGSAVSDPASARCNEPQTTFATPARLSDHTEIDVHFRCADTSIAGTLYLPRRPGRFPAVVYVHGSGEATRWTWDVPWVKQFVGAGIAFFSYDKRGVGESEGTCCPGDESHFNLLAADADGAVNALRKLASIDGRHIGFLGTSQAGWVVPLAVSRSPHRVSFAALVDGPAVSTHEEAQWSDLAGEESDNPPPLTPALRAELARKLTPGGFDPRPLLAATTVPGLWLYGAEDRSQPSEVSAGVLTKLRRRGKDFTVVVYPHAGHGLLDVPPTDERAMPRLLEWVQQQVR
jgi:uncharacterized protein